MSKENIHDADIAIRYRKDAKRHANAFLGWAIVAGVVWFFIGWLYAALPGALGLFAALQYFNSSIERKRLLK